MSRNRSISIVLTALLAILFVPGNQAFAQGVPQSMTHQGRLLDDNGSPISGNVELTYTLYDAASSGSILWQEEKTVVVSESGFYSVEIGSNSNPITATILSDGSAWMGVAVNGGAELQPRISLTSVPFALRADSAHVAVTVQDGSITSSSLAEDFSLSAEHISEAGPTLGGLSCANGEVARSTGSGWECGPASEGGLAAVTAGDGISVGGSADAPQISADFGTTAGTVAAGDDARFSDERDPTSGSSHYIQNQNAAPQDASFSISGDAEVHGGFRAPNWPVASGYTTTNVSSGNKVEYEHILVNTGDHFDPVTQFFTAPVDGVYEMCASIYRTSSSGVVMSTEVEGEEVFGGWWLYGHDSRSRNPSGCIIFPAEAGDRIGNYNSGSNTFNCSNGGPGTCQFNIKLVHAH